MGNEAYSVMAGAQYTPSPNTTLVAKQGDQAGDPTPPGGIRGYGSYALPAGMGDKDGASYRTQVAFPPMTMPMAAQTQANGRILKGAVNRNVPNFGDAYSDTRSL
jgi:hypothetical protein